MSHNRPRHRISHLKQSPTRREKSSRLHGRIFQSLMDHSTDGIVVTDEQGVVIEWNGAMERLTGLARADAVGQYFYDMEFRLAVPEHQTEDLRRRLETAMREFHQTGQLSDKVHRIEQYIQRPDGERRFFQNAAFSISTDRGYMLVSIVRDITRQHDEDERLRILLAAVEQSPASIVVTDTDGNIEYVNPKFTQLTGYTLAEVQDQNPRILKSGEMPPETCQELWQTITQGGEWRGEFHNRKKNGELYYESASIVPIKDGSGRIIRYIAVKEDITARKAAEAALSRATMQLLHLNRIVSLATATLDTRQVLDIACHELGAAFGVPQVAAALIEDDGAALKVIAEYRAPERPSAIGHLIPVQDNPAVRYLQQYQIPLAVTDALHDPLLAQSRPLVIERGIQSILLIPLFVRGKLVGSIGVDSTQPRVFTPDEIVLAASIAQAVTQPLENSLLHGRLAEHNLHLEQVVAERTARLRQVNDRMAIILNNTADAIILAKSDNTIENVNPAFQRLFGYTPDETGGLPLTDMAAPEYREPVAHAIDRARTQGVPQRIQAGALRREGTVFDADFVMARVEGDGAYLVCSVRDITHLKEIERMKDQFVSMVSHELRTPAASLLLGSELLKTHYARMNKDQRLKATERIHQQARTLSDLIAAILDISRVDARTRVESTTPVDMRQVVTRILAELQGMVTDRSHTLESLIADDTPVIFGDVVDFERIWRNLIGNAIKYTPDGGRITVRLGGLHVAAGGLPQSSTTLQVAVLPLLTLTAGHYLVGQITDNGPGIPPEDIPRLFTRFFRGQAAGGRIPGTGLGLALVRELLHLYQGEIGVMSQVNQGSTFSFWIPVAT